MYVFSNLVSENYGGRQGLETTGSLFSLIVSDHVVQC